MCGAASLKVGGDGAEVGGRGGGFGKVKAEGVCAGQRVLWPTKPLPRLQGAGSGTAFKWEGVRPVRVGGWGTGWRGRRPRPPRGGSELEAGGAALLASYGNRCGFPALLCALRVGAQTLASDWG